jgi:hypothetical protein
MIQVLYETGKVDMTCALWYLISDDLPVTTHHFISKLWVEQTNEDRKALLEGREPPNIIRLRERRQPRNFTWETRPRWRKWSIHYT